MQYLTPISCTDDNTPSRSMPFNAMYTIESIGRGYSAIFVSPERD